MGQFWQKETAEAPVVTEKRPGEHAMQALLSQPG